MQDDLHAQMERAAAREAELQEQLQALQRDVATAHSAAQGAAQNSVPQEQRDANAPTAQLTSGGSIKHTLGSGTVAGTGYIPQDAGTGTTTGVARGGTSTHRPQLEAKLREQLARKDRLVRALRDAIKQLGALCVQQLPEARCMSCLSCTTRMWRIYAVSVHIFSWTGALNLFGSCLLLDAWCWCREQAD